MPGARRGGSDPLLHLAYLSAAVIGATGGARLTGLLSVDVAVLTLAAAALAACAARSRTLSLYVATAASAVLQPAALPLVMGGLGLIAALGRRWQSSVNRLGAVAGGLGWACAVGAFGSPPARLVVIAVAAWGAVAWSAYRHGSRRFRRRARPIAIAVGTVGAAARRHRKCRAGHEELGRVGLTPHARNEDWRIDYNEHRPHSAHGDLTPSEFATAWTTRYQPALA